MKLTRSIGRLFLPASFVLLAACQTPPSQQVTEAEPTPPAETAVEAASQGAPVAVFLADTVSQQGWTPVQIQAGTLYVNPQPVITRDDLTGVQAGASQDGTGLLALALNNVGQKKVTDITTQNPNKRLALVVGRTMLAAPSFTTPVSTDQLVFAVGTEENATAAARAIAGVDEEGNPINTQNSEPAASLPGTPPAGSAIPASPAGATSPSSSAVPRSPTNPTTN